MKNIIHSFFGMLIVGLITMALPQQAKAQIDPWPWGAEVAFPWKGIEGLWEGSGAQGSGYAIFSFEVVKGRTGPKQVRVRQVHPETLEVVATGTGIEENKILRALMIGPGGIKYSIRIKAIKDTRANKGNERLTVLTAQSLNGDWIYHFNMTKISDVPLGMMPKDKAGGK